MYYYHYIYFFAAYKYHAKTISRGMFFNIYTSFFMLSTLKYLFNDNITYCLIAKYIVK